MKNKKEFKEILDGCLESVLRGESIEACLELYPDQAEELRPLLVTAASAKSAVDIKPRREFRDRAGYEFQKAIREVETAPAVRREAGVFQTLLRPAWATLILVVIVLAAGSGTVYAANSSLPGETLYSVKMATESVRMVFAFSEEAKANLYVKLADRRVDEIIQMAEQGNTEQVVNTTDKLEEQLLAMSNLKMVGGAEALEMQIAELDAAAGPPSMLSSEAMQAPVPTMLPEEHGDDQKAVTEEAGAPALAVPGAGEAAIDGGEERASQPEAWPLAGEEDGLKYDIANSAVTNSRALNSLLPDADNEMQAALNRAIEILNAGYSNIISNLD
jgi:hypothetical protein